MSGLNYVAIANYLDKMMSAFTDRRLLTRALDSSLLHDFIEKLAVGIPRTLSVRELWSRSFDSSKATESDCLVNCFVHAAHWISSSYLSREARGKNLL